MSNSLQPHGLVCYPSVHGILQARILEWVAMTSSRRSSQPRDQTPVSHISCTGKWILYHQHHLGTPFIDSLLHFILTTIQCITYLICYGLKKKPQLWEAADSGSRSHKHHKQKSWDSPKQSTSRATARNRSHLLQALWHQILLRSCSSWTLPSQQSPTVLPTCGSMCRPL